ncbi:HD domain-containing protein [Nonomuraea sp. NPDC048826]|uniref:HD domain-containing protein n=1 Tax=Nonomuraea sp. NPDC048826 TaxID=3364347 RepID=UPI00371083E7
MSARPQPALSLRQAALQRRLPLHQVMDQPTLTWIAAHRPARSTCTVAVPDPPIPMLPEVAWFALVQAVDGIHGVRHNARVCFLADLLARHHGLDDEQSNALRLAAAVHDCRRHDDRTDAGHGQRAGHWLARHHQAVTASLGLHLSTEAVTAACAAVSLHNVDHNGFSAAQRVWYARAPQLTDLLKAADCLDRYRLPLTRWWPDPARLRVSVPAWMHDVAVDLMLASEQARLDGATHHEAITVACHTVSHLP